MAQCALGNRDRTGELRVLQPSLADGNAGSGQIAVYDVDNGRLVCREPAGGGIFCSHRHSLSELPHTEGFLFAART